MLLNIILCDHKSIVSCSYVYGERLSAPSETNRLKLFGLLSYLLCYLSATLLKNKDRDMTAVIPCLVNQSVMTAFT